MFGKSVACRKIFQSSHATHDRYWKCRKTGTICEADFLSKGGSGKSEFITWLRAGQKDLVYRLFPIDSVDLLINAVTEIFKHKKVDVFMINDTRTKGEKTFFNNMFEAIALGCSTIKIISFRGKIYVRVKILSKGCMAYRNLCANENC